MITICILTIKKTRSVILRILKGCFFFFYYEFVPPISQIGRIPVIHEYSIGIKMAGINKIVKYNSSFCVSDPHGNPEHTSICALTYTLRNVRK